MRLIDADNLMLQVKAIHNAVDTSEINNDYNTGFHSATSQIQGLIASTIEAEPVKHGRWETANDGTHFCPHCGYDAPYAWDDINRYFINSADDVPDRQSNYCPNCGARMDGDSE